MASSLESKWYFGAKIKIKRVMPQVGATLSQGVRIGKVDAVQLSTCPLCECLCAVHKPCSCMWEPGD